MRALPCDSKSLPLTALLAALIVAAPLASAQGIGVGALQLPAVVPGVVAPILPGGQPTDPCDPRQGNGQPSPLCPAPYPNAACVGVALAVRTKTLAQDSIVTEGVSRAEAFAGGYPSFSQSSGSGSLQNANLLNGYVVAGTLESNCMAFVDATQFGPFTFATSHADAQYVSIAGGLVWARVLRDDSTVFNKFPAPPTGSDVVELCGPVLGCRTITAAPNTVVPLGPGLTAIVNERFMGPPGAYFGKTLNRGAALHLIVAPLGPDPGADIYVSYTAAAA